MESLRLAEHEIIGDSQGLHLARDAKEWEAYCAAYDRRLRSMWRTRRALRRTLRRLREREANVEQMRWTA